MKINAQTPTETSCMNPQVISYLALRRALGILGLSFPVILVAGSMISGECSWIQSSISLYYHTGMRNVFVGVLFALAVFLFAYKGYDLRDAIAGKLGCLFALGIAFFPTSVTEHCNSITSSIHFFSAGSFFLVLSYFSIVLFTKGSINPTRRKKMRNKLYRICGYTILGCALLIALYLYIFEKRTPSLKSLNPVFWLESMALWAFGISWLTKGKAILRDLEENNPPPLARDHEPAEKS
jgi:hypothetical protein